MFEDSAPTTAQMAAVVARWAATADRHAPTDLAAELVTIAQTAARLAGVQRLRQGQFDRTDRTDRTAGRGMPVSTVTWLAAQTATSPAAGRRQLHTARVLAEVLPATAAAFRAGDLSADQADIICRAVGSTEATRTAAAGKEDELLAIARSVSVRELPYALRHWQLVVDPTGADRAEQHAFDHRWLQISPTFEGAVAVNGMLDAAGGAAVVTAIEALAAPTGLADTRRRSTRQADALVQLARHALDRKHLPDVAGERPHLTVTLDYATLTRRTDHPAKLDHIGPVRGELARRIACDAGVVRVITDGPSEILDVGRRTRVVGPALRRALHTRDGGCTAHGCDRPPDWCDAHHLRHWADGGPTTLANLTLLCPEHHRAAHHDGTTAPADRHRWRRPQPTDPRPDRPTRPDQHRQAGPAP